jgi:hypothetical protein
MRRPPLVLTCLLILTAAALGGCDPQPAPPVEVVPDEDAQPPVNDLDECPRADNLPCN